MLHSSPDRRQSTVLASQRGTSGNNASEVQTFAAYAGITDITQITALDYLIDNLKSSGLWNKMYFIYPFIGGNATSHKYELIDPSNSSKELTFTGVTHNSTGITGTASANASAVSGINATTHDTNNFSMGYYGTLKGSTAVTTNESGVMYLSSRTFLSFISQSSNTIIYYGSTANTLTSVSIPDGFKALTSTSTTTGNLLFNQITYSTLTKSITALTGFYGHELSRTTNTAVNTVSFSYASTQLTESELVTLNTIVEQYQTLLGRNSYYINTDYDPVVNRFLFNSTPANFTSNEKNALNYLVSNLKAGSNIWSKLSFIYPYASASNLAASLKDLKSLGTATLTIVGSATQSSLGVETGLSTSYATYPGTYGVVNTVNSIILSIQEDFQSAGYDFNTSATRYSLNVRNASNQAVVALYAGSTTISNTNAIGLYQLDVSGVLLPFTLYKNNSVLGSGTTGNNASSGTPFNFGPTGSTRIQGFFAATNGVILTSTERTEAYNIILTYLQLLGRA
jgi:hypothetical protein